MCVTDDPALARRVFLSINKAWGYGDEQPDHYFVALNYRMNELTGAVAASQLGKLQQVVESRIRTADELSRQLRSINGLQTPQVSPRSLHTYWKYCLNVDASVIPGGSVALGRALKERGIICAPRYIQNPAFRCQVFAEQRTFGDSRWPFTLARPEAVDYAAERFPGTFQALEHVLVLPWNEKYTQEHVDAIATVIGECVAELTAEVNVEHRTSNIEH